jgi:uncharacterized membrane protein YcaP (DUF421 family)
MWIFNHVLWEIFLRTSIIYILVLIGIRLTGKREVGQMTPFDLVLLLLIANAVQNAMTGPDTSLTGGLVAAGTLLFINFIVNGLVFRSIKVQRWVEGTPTLLIHEGKIVGKNLEKEKITADSLQQALREHGVSSVNLVHLAVLEVDGAISVIRKDELPAISRPHHRIRFLKRQST